MSRDYEKMYEKLKSFEDSLHEKNQKKIRIGIKVNIFLPLVFLLLCFAVPDANFVFLIMWIISLFGIATYLIYVEYSDYKIQSVLREMGFIDEPADTNLMGDFVETKQQAASEKLSAIESRMAAEKERFTAVSKERSEALREKLDDIKSRRNDE